MSPIDKAEAELIAAIKRRREAEGSRWENALLATMVLVPLTAFVFSVVRSMI